MDKAAIYASHTTTIAIILGITFAVFFFLSPQLILAFFRLDADITAEAVDYLKIVSFCIPFIFLILNFSGIYIGSGRSDIPFYFNAAGLLLNIVLDPLFIFGLGPIPMMGSKGAALATTLSQGVVTVLFIRHLRGNTGAIGRFAFWIKLRRGYTVNILKLGIRGCHECLLFLNQYEPDPYRVDSRGHLWRYKPNHRWTIEGVTWNTSQGFATALGSFVAQNFAAGRMDRARHAYRYTLMTMMALGLVVTASFMLFGSEILPFLSPKRQPTLAGGDYLFIIGISQLFMMLEITTQGMFNGIGKTAPPAVVSIGFNTLRVPFAIFMASAMGSTASGGPSRSLQS